VAEGGGLLNRYRAKSSIGGSNPPLSASIFLNVPEQAESAETSVNLWFSARHACNECKPGNAVMFLMRPDRVARW
jgi:hypothetical protein